MDLNPWIVGPILIGILVIDRILEAILIYKGIIKIRKD